MITNSLHYIENNEVQSFTEPLQFEKIVSSSYVIHFLILSKKSKICETCIKEFSLSLTYNVPLSQRHVSKILNLLMK